MTGAVDMVLTTSSGAAPRAEQRSRCPHQFLLGTERNTWLCPYCEAAFTREERASLGARLMN